MTAMTNKRKCIPSNLQFPTANPQPPLSDIQSPPSQLPTTSRHWLKGALAVLLLVLVPGLPAHTAPELPFTYPSPNERLGFGVTRGINNVSPDILGSLHAGWYVNWGSAPTAPHPNGLTYVQIIRLGNNSYSPNGEELLNIIGDNPGSLWLVGNEPDSPYQDNQTPEQYVEKYHEIYQLIKAADPTALVAIGGVIQATPLRLEYLDRIWNEYQARYGEEMPVDVWNVHNFILREARVYCSAGGIWGAYIPPGIDADCGVQYRINDHDNMDIFRQQIFTFRQWMKQKGQQNKPLIVSEYGILFNEELGFSLDRVRNFMLATFDFFITARDPDLGYPEDDYHLVQQWAWYSLDDTSFEWGTTHSALYNDKEGKLTPLGQSFSAYAAGKRTPYVDLRPEGLAAWGTDPVSFPGTGTLTLQVSVSNDGNEPGAGRVRVQRYLPSGDLMLVGEAPVQNVPTRYLGATTVTLSDYTVFNAPLRYRITTIADNDPRPWNDVMESEVTFDLAVVGAEQMTAYAPPGGVGRLRIVARIRNDGPVPMRDIPVRLLHLEGEQETIVTHAYTDEVPPGGEGTVTLVWLQPAGRYRVAVVVDPWEQLQETLETNNRVELEVWVAAHQYRMPLYLK